jgi:hypothetical protein
MTKDQFISIFGSYANLARDIDEGETTVRNWFSPARASIPTRCDAAIIAAAARREKTITPVDLHYLRLSLRSSVNKSSKMGRKIANHAVIQ